MRQSGILVLVAALMLVGAAGTAMAASDTATHDVTVTLSEIAELAVAGGNITLTFAAPATPGNLPAAVSDATTSLAWTSNVAAGSRAVTAELSTAYTAGIALKVTVTSPAGTNGAPTAQVTLTAVAQNVFTGITNENCSAATLTYEASLSQMIAPTSETKTVTYTLLDAA